MATDPICRMQVEEDQAAVTAEYDGKQYYFCCQGCKEKFEQNPEHYAKALEQPGE